MKSIIRILTAVLLVLTVLSGCGKSPELQTPGKLSVVASFYPMYDFATKIGGDKVSVKTLVPAGTEPHDWEPSAADISSLEQAAVFICNGADMEGWAAGVIKSLENKNLLTIEAAAGIPLIEGDPHVWLNPQYAKAEMENIKNALAQADPGNKDYYEANYKKVAGELDALDKEFKDTLTPLPGKNIVVAHQAFSYLCQAYGLNQVAIEGLSAESEPDPARMAEIIEFAQAHNVKVIFFEELVSPDVAETIAGAINAKTDVLNPLEGLTDAQLQAGDDYFSVMRLNLQALKSALQ
jgi:zinc transport system substrate-binding protein